MQIKYLACALFSALLFCTVSCKKLVSVSEPINSITTSETFDNDANAKSAVIAIYGKMSYPNGSLTYGNGSISRICALSADELSYFNTSDDFYMEFQDNTIQAAYLSGTINGQFWSPIYFSIYQANACIEGLEGSKTVSPSLKANLIGESKFIRAFCNFYLTNLFGDIPLISSTSWSDNKSIRRSSSSDVYSKIILDLKEAKNLLPLDYSSYGEERIRPTKWTAAAMLARAYLFIGDYSNAEAEADSVISNSSLFSLNSSLADVFLANSSESIWQLQILDQYPYATMDGNQFIPADTTSSPYYYLTDQLINDFEQGDKRRINWVDSTHFSDVYYYYPYKYKVSQGVSGSISEYYMVLRLAEQFLIRAEARASKFQPDMPGAIEDLNVIRERAGLLDFSGSVDKNAILKAILHERRIELFSEWGHRWLDLKRTGNADTILDAMKPQWKPSQKLYPIPITELQTNSLLTQNEGY